jgi:D-aminoacyl-tRNA deacylase
MRILLQRVQHAEVRIRPEDPTQEARVSGRIGTGYLLLVGFTHSDTIAEVRWMADKVAGLRLFQDDQGRMNVGLDEVGGSILVVSQFTLYGDSRKGRRPSFVDAAPPAVAIPLYEALIDALETHGLVVATGEFGAMMDVELVNDGPVTLWLEREAGH